MNNINNCSAVLVLYSFHTLIRELNLKGFSHQHFKFIEKIEKPLLSGVVQLQRRNSNKA